MSTMRSKIKTVLSSTKSTKEMTSEITNIVKNKGAYIESSAVSFILDSKKTIEKRLFNIVESID
jgi:hypothetical protein